MKFEHFEGISAPDEQFDRLGKKEDLNFLAKELPEDMNGEKDKAEKLRYNEELIKLAEAKVAELEKEIMFMAEDDAKYPGQSLEEKNLELKAAQADLASLLKKSSPANDSLNRETQPAKNKIDSKIFNN
jgi:hypothetical protein